MNAGGTLFPALSALLFLLGSLVGQVTPLAAADYYLNARKGDDSNSGITEDQAWKTLDALNSFKWNTGFQPGDHIRFQRGSVFAGTLSIDGQSGIAGEPIIYEDYGSGNMPVFDGIRIDRQHHITVRNLEVDSSGGDGLSINGTPSATSYSITVSDCLLHGVDSNTGIMVEGGDIHDITLQNNEVHNFYVGLYLASDTGGDYPNLDKSDDQPLGCGNLIEGNHIHGNLLTGIAVDALGLKEYAEAYICDGSSDARARNIVRNNTVEENGGHGMEITANHLLVEHNRFIHNGTSRTLGGFSGIHLFDRWPAESGPDSDRYERGGDWNIICGNISRDNRDRLNDRTDGNGIQMDMWCDHNQVYNNIAYGNDGAGIIAFGARSNSIYNNTLYNNGLDIGRRYGANELVVVSAEIDHPDEADVQDSKGNNLLVSRGNEVVNNIALAIGSDNENHPLYPGVIDCRIGECRYALAVDDYVSGDTLDFGDSRFAHNLWFNSQTESQAVAIIKVSENEHFQIPPGSTSLEAWNGRDAVNGDIAGDPLFLDARDADFHLSQIPLLSPAVDQGLLLDLFSDDFEGTGRPQGTGWDIGALEALQASRPAEGSDSENGNAVSGEVFPWILFYPPLIIQTTER